MGTTNGIDVSPDGKKLYVNESAQLKVWIYDIKPDGTLKNKKDKAMKPEAIMEMDWLTDNVIGEIPTMGELRAEARPVVQIKGVEEKMK